MVNYALILTTEGTGKLVLLRQIFLSWLVVYSSFQRFVRYSRTNVSFIERPQKKVVISPISIQKLVVENLLVWVLRTFDAGINCIFLSLDVGRKA